MRYTISFETTTNGTLLSPFHSPAYIWGKLNFMYFFLKEPKSNKETIIYLIHFLKHEGKNFKYSTGQKRNPDNWDFINRLPKTKRGAGGVKNRHLTTVLSRYAEFLEEMTMEFERTGERLTRISLRDSFDRKFKGKDSTPQALSFIQTVQLFIDSKNKSGSQTKTWNFRYSAMKKKLEYFEEYKGKEIQFENLNDDWLDEFSGFLRSIKREPFKPHNDNTLHRNIGYLFTFLKWAKGKHHNIDLEAIRNPVRSYQADDVHLTDDEIKVLEEINLPRMALEKIRDLFLIGIYSGQRFSDYSVFEKSDVQSEMIIKRAEKTETDSFIPLHPKLKSLLDKYDWDLPKISSQKFNVYIQEVCELAGIDDEIKETVYRRNKKEVLYKPKYKMITSHTARRTFITLSSEKGMADHLIMKITGIRDPKTLHKNKKTSQRSVVEAMDKYWG